MAVVVGTRLDGPALLAPDGLDLDRERVTHWAHPLVREPRTPPHTRTPASVARRPRRPRRRPRRRTRRRPWRPRRRTRRRPWRPWRRTRQTPHTSRRAPPRGCPPPFRAQPTEVRRPHGRWRGSPSGSTGRE